MAEAAAAAEREAAEAAAAESAAAAAAPRGLTASALADDGAPCVVDVAYVRLCTLGFDAGRALGSPGAFGAVFRGVDPVLGLRFAVKRLSNVAPWPAERSAAAEVRVLSAFRGHPGIIRLLGYTTDPAERCLVYELGGRGALSDNLVDDGLAARLTWRTRLRVAAGVAAALNFMHCSPGARAWHRDVKARGNGNGAEQWAGGQASNLPVLPTHTPRLPPCRAQSANIVLSDALQPKLIDCGLSKLLTPGEAARGAATATGGSAFGTPGYMCPVYCKRHAYDAAAEVFSFGVVLLELLTGRLQLGGDQRGLDLVDELALEGPAELAARRDPRAGGWSPPAAAAAEALAAQCVAGKPGQRPRLIAALRTLNALAAAHCAPTADESAAAAELAAARAALERLRAAEEGAAVARAAAARECCIFAACDGGLTLDDGLECGPGGHFTCAGCLALLVEAEAAAPPADLARRAGAVICPLRGQGCAAPPFSAAALARRVPEATFARHNAAAVRARERALAAAMQANYDARLRDAERRLAEGQARAAAAAQAAARTAAERGAAATAALAEAVIALRIHVADKVLTLHCPRCDQAFVELNGCCALACGRCDCRFCAWCLRDCGGAAAGDAAAHRHVAGCAHNAAPGRDVFASKALFDASQRARRARTLAALLAAQPAAVRAPLLAALAGDLADLGMRAADF